MIIKVADKRLGSIEDRAQLRDQILLERKLDERFEKQEAEREYQEDLARDQMFKPNLFGGI
jgi:hypothetical protein